MELALLLQNMQFQAKLYFELIVRSFISNIQNTPRS